MTTLAIDGGKPNVTGPLPRFNTIGQEEIAAAELVLTGGALSGFLGGETRGGYWVRRLEDKWAETFGVKHAVACNSATSGLLAACVAVGVGPGTDVVTTPYTMSATAAAPALLGARIAFADVTEYEWEGDYGLSPLHAERLLYGTNAHPPLSHPKAVIATNLFGHPARLTHLRKLADHYRVPLIEDNAQSPFAMENGRYAGTIGHIGVFSLNVHKHLQTGEGGVCVTDDHDLALKMRHFLNHGEMAGDRVGLNLRMTELTAGIALAQLRKGERIVNERIERAKQIIAAIGDIPGLRPPIVRAGCKHVYYTIPFVIEGDRSWFVKALAAEGVPLTEGYVAPLYRLPAFSAYARPCPVAEDLHDRRLFYYENCAYDPLPEQIRQIGDAFQKVAEHRMVEK